MRRRVEGVTFTSDVWCSFSCLNDKGLVLGGCEPQACARALSLSTSLSLYLSHDTLNWHQEHLNIFPNMRSFNIYCVARADAIVPGMGWGVGFPTWVRVRERQWGCAGVLQRQKNPVKIPKIPKRDLLKTLT